MNSKDASDRIESCILEDESCVAALSRLDNLLYDLVHWFDDACNPSMKAK